MSWSLWWTIPIALAIGAGAIALIVKAFDRDLTSGGTRSTTGGGNPFGGLTEVFDPGAHRAELEKERLKHQVAVTPSADPDRDKNARIITDRYGNPIGFRPVPTTPRPSDTPADLLGSEPDSA